MVVANAAVDSAPPEVYLLSGERVFVPSVCVEFAGGPVTGGTSTLARLVDGHRSTTDKARMSAGLRDRDAPLEC